MNATAKFQQIDSECDISDAWRELTDPENERGECATALFEHSRATAFHASDSSPSGVTVPVPLLVGLRIENLGVTELHSRDWAMRVFGPKEISRIEDAQYNSVNE